MGMLTNKVAIITGAGTGIGEAIAKKFCEEEAKVLLCGLPGDPVKAVVAKLANGDGNAVAFEGNLAEEKDAKEAVDCAIKCFGKIDILINNAGVFLNADETQDYPVEMFDRTITNNIRSVFLMTKFALPHLHETQGNIVSAGSEAGMIGLANNTTYGGTKAWIHAFMEGVAVEQAKYNVRANCVLPGPIDTAWTHKETGPMDKEMEDALVKAVPLGRRGTVEEVANVYAFLASDQASYVTGALFSVDGGTTKAKGPVGEKAMDKSDLRDFRPSNLAHTHEGNENRPR